MNDEHGSTTKASRVTTRVNLRAGRSLLQGPATPRAAAAPRQLQTRWLLIVAVLVLLGGVVLMYAVPRYTQHTSVVVMARDVTMGATLTAADVTTADVALGPQVAVVHPQDGPVLGQTALTDLRAGAVLSPRQIGPAPVLAAGQDLVPVRLKLGQRPQQGLSPGQRVLAGTRPGRPRIPGRAVPAGDGPDQGHRGLLRGPGPRQRGRCGRPAGAREGGRRAGPGRGHRVDDPARRGGRERAVTAVAVVAGKASPGASTVAVALTLSWPVPVLLIDADPAGGDVMPGLLPGRAPTERGLLSWLVATRHLPAMDATAVLPRHCLALPEAGNAWVLPGLQSPSQAGVLTGGGWARLATTLERCHPVLGRDVVIDTGRLGEGSCWPVIAACDVVLLVVRPTARSVQGAVTAAEMLRARLGDLALVRLVVNGAGQYAPAQVGAELAFDPGQVVQLPGDPRTAASLVDGCVTTAFGLSRTRLIRSAGGLAEQITAAARRSDLGPDQPLERAGGPS